MRGGDHIEKFPRRLDLGEETRCNQQIFESGQFPIPDDVISKCNLILSLSWIRLGLMAPEGPKVMCCSIEVPSSPRRSSPL